MKKTLIALTIATVSGSAMAESGTFTFSGVLDIPKNMPWEVLISQGKSGFNAGKVEMIGDDNEQHRWVKLHYEGTIPILGIRTKNSSFFEASSAISPQIDFGGMLDLNDGDKGKAKLSIPAKDTESGEIFATFIAPLTMGAGVLTNNLSEGTVLQAEMIAPQQGNAFFGGLPKAAGMSLKKQTVYSTITRINAEFTKNFPNGEYPKWDSDYISSDFSEDNIMYNAFYGSGIDANQGIGLLLNDSVKLSKRISWVASLPITVSYM